MPSCSMWLVEKHLAGKLPRSGEVFLRVLTAPLEVFELSGKRLREFSIDAGIAAEGVDVLSNNGTDRSVRLSA